MIREKWMLHSEREQAERRERRNAMLLVAVLSILVGVAIGFQLGGWI